VKVDHVPSEIPDKLTCGKIHPMLRNGLVGLSGVTRPGPHGELGTRDPLGPIIWMVRRNLSGWIAVLPLAATQQNTGPQSAPYGTGKRSVGEGLFWRGVGREKTVAAKFFHGPDVLPQQAGRGISTEQYLLPIIRARWDVPDRWPQILKTWRAGLGQKGPYTCRRMRGIKKLT